MLIPPAEYCGDKKLRECLNRFGARLSIFQVYGLIYGCIAAPHIVMPPQLLSRIFGDKFSFNSIDEANEVLSVLLSLESHSEMGAGEESLYVS